DITGDEQIEPAIAIVVDKGAAGAPTRCPLVEPGLLSDVDEFALAVIPVKDVLSIVGHEYVVIAVVIKIAETHALAQARLCQVRVTGDVGKRSIPVIVVKMIRGFLAVVETFECRAVDHKDVGPPVVIDVDQSNAAASRFEDILLLRTGTRHMPGVESCSRGDILKPYRGRLESGFLGWLGPRAPLWGSHSLRRNIPG